MKQLAKIMLVALAFGIVAVAGGQFNASPSQAAGNQATPALPTVAPQPVKVVNTPLPVQGTVGAQQNGTWNVGITGGPVTVSNVLDASSNPVPIVVRDADNPARQPFTATCALAPDTAFATAGFAENCAITGNYPRVPPNKRLVIEYVSVHAVFVPGQLANVQVQFISGGNNTLVDFIPTNGGRLVGPPAGATATVSMASSPTRLYVDPGSFIDCYGYNNQGSLFTDGSCTFSGYLITP